MSDSTIGWLLFADSDWAEARDAFPRALEVDAGDPDALDGVGQSLWWVSVPGTEATPVARSQERAVRARSRAKVRPDDHSVPGTPTVFCAPPVTGA
jgi:hypothetical protein